MPEIEATKISSRGIADRALEIAKREKLTLRQTALLVAGARGQFVVKGTAHHIADVMEEWFRSGACDGFNLMPPYLPGALDDFITHVVPALQTRGLFRTEYEGKTLRENPGLKIPINRY